MKVVWVLALVLGVVGSCPAQQTGSLAVLARAQDVALSPEGNAVTLSGTFLPGWNHFNQHPAPGLDATFSRFSTCDGFTPGPLPPQPQSGTVSWSHSRLDLDVEEDLERIRTACLPQHHWPAMQDSMPLTTEIRFLHTMYGVAQYAPGLLPGDDTLYVVPWTTMPLPGPDEPQVIWVEGVARVRGVVDGSITLLASDSLFIMGDLVTADVILEPCAGNPPAEGTPFGTVPADSPRFIGLVGEGNVILAATLENGFANGMVTPGGTCGLPNPDPLINVCLQGRQDIVVTASILALGCCLESEFWQTTAYWATVPPPASQIEVCGGSANTHVRIWDLEDGCVVMSQLHDRRGTVFLYGSLVQRASGFLVRGPTGPWGQAWIGYEQRSIRHDPRLLAQAPPYWPEARWQVPELDIQLVTDEVTVCGEVADPDAFVADWNQLLGVELTVQPNEGNLPANLQLVTWVDGVARDSSALRVTGSETWHPSLDLSPWLENGARVWVEVRQGEWWALPGSPANALDSLEVYSRWNADGEECAWEWNGTGVEPTQLPTEFRLGQPWPNPFNPSCRVEVTLPSAGSLTLEVFDLLGRREAVVFDGALPAGAHAFTVDGSAWPAGLHLLRATHAGGVEMRKLLLVK